MKTFLLAFLAALCLSTHAADNRRMTLTDLASHICAQCGMNDTDDVSAAKMFLQRRLEMIWNSQLWRCSLIEATMTINPDGTCSLSNTVWIPQRATLLLPPEFESVLAVRQDGHKMTVASLESYYRTDIDWLNMTGDAFEFQILRPAVWEFASNTDVCVFTEGNPKNPTKLVTTQDGVSTSAFSVMPSGGVGTPMAQLLRIDSASRQDSDYSENAQFVVVGADLGQTIDVENSGPGSAPELFFNQIPQQIAVGSLLRVKGFYKEDSITPITWTGIVSSFDKGTGVVNIQRLNLPSDTSDNAAYGIMGSITEVYLCSWSYAFTLNVGNNAAQNRQRIRLTVQPNLSVNLRVLGKTTCPILGDYDAVPINNAETCLMAFARGDMLLRARQNGKAQIAQQEGATLLQALARSEAFQQASNFKIQPEGGFGDDSTFMYPNSMHPL